MIDLKDLGLCIASLAILYGLYCFGSRMLSFWGTSSRQKALETKLSHKCSQHRNEFERWERAQARKSDMEITPGKKSLKVLEFRLEELRFIKRVEFLRESTLLIDAYSKSDQYNESQRSELEEVMEIYL
jgi:hypothetical protein